MIGYVANTHADWFDFLASKHRRWDEVNFWNPSDYYGFGGEIGSPWFFRLKSPRNMIGGFGIVSRFDKLPEWLAWECFREGNGSPTLENMQARLKEIRERNHMLTDGRLPQIGCFILSNAFFFPEGLWISQPNNWASRNLRYKSYDLSEGEGLRVWRECQERASLLEADALPAPTTLLREATPRYGEPTLIAPRLGQGGFRLAVTAAYDRACAVTGEHSLPALEAAHIRPFAEGGSHSVSNGLLLRSDLHRLFDRNYLTVTPDYRLKVSGRLRDHFSNGKSYYPLDGQRIALPQRAEDRPDRELLEWHSGTRFQS